jgi:hypothetical protein
MLSITVPPDSMALDDACIDWGTSLAGASPSTISYVVWADTTMAMHIRKAVKIIVDFNGKSESFICHPAFLNIRADPFITMHRVAFRQKAVEFI